MDERDPRVGWVGGLQVAKVAYEFYAGYTGITLPLPKMDMVAVPGRRHAEPHWGLAMFDDRRFLFNRVGTCCTILMHGYSATTPGTRPSPMTT